MSGDTVESLTKRIKEKYAVVKSRAKLIAQDQTLKLYADLTRYRAESLGVDEYIWRTVGDSRVRPDHADKNGKKYTLRDGANGLHPGRAVRCRCRMELIFDN